MPSRWSSKRCSSSWTRRSPCSSSAVRCCAVSCASGSTCRRPRPRARSGSRRPRPRALRSRRPRPRVRASATSAASAVRASLSVRSSSAICSWAVAARPCSAASMRSTTARVSPRRSESAASRISLRASSADSWRASASLPTAFSSIWRARWLTSSSSERLASASAASWSSRCSATRSSSATLPAPWARAGSGGGAGAGAGAAFGAGRGLRRRGRAEPGRPSLRPARRPARRSGPAPDAASGVLGAGAPPARSSQNDVSSGAGCSVGGRRERPRRAGSRPPFGTQSTSGVSGWGRRFRAISEVSHRPVAGVDRRTSSSADRPAVPPSPISALGGGVTPATDAAGSDGPTRGRGVEVGVAPAPRLQVVALGPLVPRVQEDEVLAGPERLEAVDRARGATARSARASSRAGRSPAAAGAGVLSQPGVTPGTACTPAAGRASMRSTNVGVVEDPVPPVRLVRQVEPTRRPARGMLRRNARPRWRSRAGSRPRRRSRAADGSPLARRRSRPGTGRGRRARPRRASSRHASVVRSGSGSRLALYTRNSGLPSTRTYRGSANAGSRWRMCSTVVLRGVLLRARAPRPSSPSHGAGPGLVGPAEAEREVGRARLEHLVERALEQAPALEPVVVVAEAVDAVVPARAPPGPRGSRARGGRRSRGRRERGAGRGPGTATARRRRCATR